MFFESCEVVKVPSRKSGFTLIELLVVIAILAILAGLGVPALKNIGKSNVSVSASRQLLDDIGRARQLAMSQRTTVYMVFVPTNFWTDPVGTYNVNWMNSLSDSAKVAATNLCDKQLSGYIFVTPATVGDQPGRHYWRYLASWQSLPDGTFIAPQKFIPPDQFFYITQWDNAYHGGSPVKIFGFPTNIIPFPTETSTAATMPPNSLPLLPYIAFNYLGQLTSDGQSLASRDEYIPLAQGSVLPAIDPSTKRLLLPGSPQISEIPSGNSTNSTYNIIHIDHLTGRAVLEFQHVQ